MLSKIISILKIPNWRLILLWAVVVGSLIFLFTWKLANLTPGFSQQEIEARGQSHSIGLILHDPINAPHKILQYVAQKTGHKGPAAMRLVSAMFALASAICFFWCAKWWFDKVLAVFGTILFVCSPWFLIAAHTATPDILLFAPLALYAAFLWLEQTEIHHDAAIICLSILAAVSFYIPGVLIITIVGGIFGWKRLRSCLKHTSPYIPLLCTALMIILILPLIASVIYDVTLLKHLLFLDNLHGLSAVELAKSIWWAAAGIVWKTRDNLPITLGHLPVLDSFAIILAALGMLWLATQTKRRRGYGLLGSLFAGIVLVGLSGDYTRLLILLPLLYLFVTAGLSYLYREWFIVFPKNPFAKSLGLGVISIVVLLSSLYGVRYALFAWPQSPETKAVYMIQ